MIKITKNTIEQIKNIDEPFNTDDSVYLYLIQHKIINFKHSYFKKLMSSYKKLNKNIKSSKDTERSIRKIEYAFCEAVEHLKTKTIYSVYKSLYEQSLEDPSVALKFLKLYDRKEKKYDEMIKTKHTAKNQAKDDNSIDNSTIEKNINEIAFLFQNAQKSNEINISNHNNNKENNNKKNNNSQ